MRNDAWTHIALIPSVYGLVLFGSALALYQLRLIAYEPTNGETLFLCLFTMITFLLSAVLHANSYRNIGRILAARMAIPGSHDAILNDHVALGVMHLIGFVGLVLYANSLVAFFGSPLALLLALTKSSYEVRWATESIHTIGVQLTYVGWIAIAVTVCAAARGSTRMFWIVLAVAQFSGNLIFVDRTRPMWILVTCGLVAMAARFHTLRTAQILRVFAVSSILLVVLFVIVGLWIGKVSTEDSGLFGVTQLPPVAQSIYYYVTSSFAYLNHIVDVEHSFGWLPERSLYPLFRVLASVGLIEPPPSQVNEFYFVPFPTNVGTILEPLYRDGGAVYATIGFAALVLTADTLALAFLKNGSFIALLGWAQICFANLLAFLTPKFNNTPLWVIVLLATAALVVHWMVRAKEPALGRIHRSQIQ